MHGIRMLATKSVLRQESHQTEPENIGRDHTDSHGTWRYKARQKDQIKHDKDLLFVNVSYFGEFKHGSRSQIFLLSELINWYNYCQVSKMFTIGSRPVYSITRLP